ncbi:hypothetical protein SUGI_1041170 [Cryptomeria japonica]|nr:hypothetical protein SUGI_1041170 [Cryptomeria japonica]
MLQEIKAVDFTLYNNLAYIWKDAVKFHTLHTRGKGGVALLVHPKWSSCIIDHGVSPCNRAVWVTIKYNNNSFGICSVYASNDWKERITLWDWIDNLPDLPWIVGGDFNMIESQADKEGGLPFTWKDGEKLHWDRMKINKLLYDPLAGNKDLSPGIWHTWCNFQQGANRIYSRLDRFYANKNLFSVLPDKWGNTVLATSTILSDHHPIKTRFIFNNSPTHCRASDSKFILNTSLLEDEDVLAVVHIISLINKSHFPHLNNIEKWDLNVTTWQNFLKTIGQKRAKDYRRIEKTLSANLQVVESHIQANPSDYNLTAQVIYAKNALSRHLQAKARGAKIRSRANWLQFGDRGSKFFFNLLKHKQTNESIDRIVIDNQDITNPDLIKEAFAKYYQNLFTSEDSVEANNIRNQCLSIIPKKITDHDAVILSAEITLGEIEKAILSLQKDKAPGPDGLPAEFYKTNIGWICHELLKVYSDALERGSLGRNINRGIIKLIPKEGDKALIKNWRPITLLNVSYKILAKILALRLQDILPKIISSTQTGFIKGRYILENVITSWEAMNWAKLSQQNCAMLLLDFEKAYDRVEWNFISMTLEAFGFPTRFCNLVKMMMNDVFAQIDINGSWSDAFPLERSIRQGCPLAPALFVISSEAFHYILRDHSMSPAVRGIRLPNNEELITSQFADDTTVFFKARDSNFEALQCKLKTFCSISGAKISYSKSVCLGWDETPPDWSNRFHYQWGGPHLVVRYLGIPFSVDPSLKAMWNWIKDKINIKLNKWHNRFLSLAGRVQVCQKILSSYNIYYSSAWMFNNYQLLEIQKAIRNFLWSDGRGSKKLHAVKWQWCHTDSLLGGVGLKDLRTQGVALAAKWIFHSMEGDSPWKILIRNNIELGFPKHAKTWKGLPLSDLIMGNFPIKVHGSVVFCSIWKAWEQVRKFVYNKDFHDSQTLYGERSIWWNLQLSGKPLTLSQGCSAKIWNKKGISQLVDLFEHNQLIPWNDLKIKFNIPDSQKKTYNMIVKATKDLPVTCDVDSNSPSVQVAWW